MSDTKKMTIQANHLGSPNSPAASGSCWRRVVSPIPAPDAAEALGRLAQVEPRSVAGLPPVCWREAEGFLVRDGCGNQWIDLTSAIVVANAGHGHLRIREAIRRTLDRPLLATYRFPQAPRTDLCEMLVSLAPIRDAKAILFSAGTEATECALMLMRAKARAAGDREDVILCFEKNYHGRTLGAALASGFSDDPTFIRRQRSAGYLRLPCPFEPGCSLPGVVENGEAAWAQCVQSIRNAGTDPRRVAGVILEPMPGWATWPINRRFLAAMRRFADQHDIPITFDEIQSGCGRTGRFFAFEHLGIVPDLIALGKGLSSSLPVSALIGRRELLDAPDPGEMSSTHGGNPLCAAAALANLQVIGDERLTEKAADTGAQVLRVLRQVQEDHPAHVWSVHGHGLFISVHLRKPGTDEPDIDLADAIAMEAVRRGVLMFTTGRGYLKVTPPLSIEADAALEAAGVIQGVFQHLVRERVRASA